MHRTIGYLIDFGTSLGADAAYLVEVLEARRQAIIRQYLDGETEEGR